MTLTPDLVIATSVGIPLTLLAIGVLAHAVLLARRPRLVGLEGVDDVLEALAAEPVEVEDLLAELHQEIDELRTQLAGQRSTLEHLLSEGTRQTRATAAPQAAPRPAVMPTPMPAAPAASATRQSFRTEPAAAAANGRPMVLGARTLRAAQHAVQEAPRAFEPAPAAGGFRAAVSQLAAEGLSDRAIARRLHVGLEEVRVARLRAGLAQ